MGVFMGYVLSVDDEEKKYRGYSPTDEIFSGLMWDHDREVWIDPDEPVGYDEDDDFNISYHTSTDPFMSMEEWEELNSDDEISSFESNLPYT